MSMSPLQIKNRIEALEWEIQNNEEENDAMKNEIKLLEKKLADYEFIHGTRSRREKKKA